jgi:hypothetical protein
MERVECREAKASGRWWFSGLETETRATEGVQEIV